MRPTLSGPQHLRRQPMLLRRSTPLALALAPWGGGPTASEHPAEADNRGTGAAGTRPRLKRVPPPPGARRWAPGIYVVAVRGGAKGVKVPGSTAGIQPQPAMFILIAAGP